MLKHFTVLVYRSAFNPFTHMVSAVYAEDLSDGWGAGMAVNVGFKRLIISVKCIACVSYLSVLY